MILSTLSSIAFLLGGVLTMISMLLGKKSTSDREKSSPYECGFEPFDRGRTPLSIRFFVISVVFLVFDVEVALLIPLIPTASNTSTIVWSFTTIVFLIILIVGVLYEWLTGALDWKN